MDIEGVLPACDYDVFLSFRGKDTRKGFTDVLYHFLDSKGIVTFRDEKLRKGQPIAKSLPKAIRESRIWIAIFSKNYASSKWCLDELAEMVDLSEKTGKEIIPIFYDVTPSDVKDEGGLFDKALAEHEKEGERSKETLQKWRAALKHVAKLSGLERANIADGKDGDLAKKTVTKVLDKLANLDQPMPPYLIGMEPHLEEVVKLLNISDEKPMTVKIHGMCGIGKTTISKAVHNKLWRKYECHCFLEDIRRKRSEPGGVVELKKQLLMKGLNWTSEETSKLSNPDAPISNGFRTKKVLIVLDDVQEEEDLLVTCEQLGPGSRIIVTTRKKGLLREAPCYEPPEMDREQSEELFRKYAFKSEKPPEMHRNISKKMADIASGLPISLKLMGEYFHEFTDDMWADNCKMLENEQLKRVREHLEVSYKQELQPGTQRQIFLDIACFLIGVDQRIACHMWKAPTLIPKVNLEILNSLSLVKIGYNNEFNMHRQMRDFGRGIVLHGFTDAVEKGSRLFYHKDAHERLSRNLDRAKDKVLALCLDFQSPDSKKNDQRSFGEKSFEKLSNLGFLQLDCAELTGNTKAQLCKLNWLSWKVPLQNSTPINFNLENLAVLDLSNSKITKEWAGWSLFKVAEKLKVLNLTGCDELHQTPDLSAFRKLERLILEDCKSLIRIDTSAAAPKKCLRKLVYLNLRNCEKLETISRVPGFLVSEEIIIDGTGVEELPSWSEARGKKLQVLSTIGCKKLENIDSIAGLQSLTRVALDHTPITSLPNWSGGCKEKLQVLSTIGCKKLENIGSIAGLQSLTRVTLDHTPITGLPVWSGECAKTLQVFSAIGCEKLENIDSIAGLQSLTRVTLDHTPITGLPNWSGGCKEKLQVLSTIGCEKLENIDSVADLRALIHVALNDTPITKLPMWSQACKEKLRELSVIGCRNLVNVNSIADLQSLTNLALDKTLIAELPSWSKGCKKNLEKLSVIGCKNLASIHSIEYLQSLTHVAINDTQITKLPTWSVGCEEKLQVLSASGCMLLENIDSIDDLESLTSLTLDGTLITKLPSWSKGCEKKLEILSVIGCKSLRSINSIQDLQSLTNLALDETPISELPSLFGSVLKLNNLSLKKCNKLKMLPHWIDSLHELRSLSLTDCQLPKGYLNLSKFPKLDLEACNFPPELVRAREEPREKVHPYLIFSHCSRRWSFCNFFTSSENLKCW